MLSEVMAPGRSGIPESTGVRESTGVPGFTTADGAVIPRIGLGTWQLRDEACALVVAEALRLGYTHVDTAQGYGNEAAVGEGLAASGVRRESVFVTTKVRTDYLGEGDLQRSVDESLKKLRIEQIDLLLLHWPNPQIELADSIGALNAVKRDGRVRHIGLSNFTTRLLDEAWRLTRGPTAWGSSPIARSRWAK